MLEELLEKYDLYHSSIICGGKVKFNINYILSGKVYISLNALINGIEYKDSYDFIDDKEFRTFSLPKILQRFFSKNIGVTIRKIMGNETNGTLIIEKKDLKDSLIIRNCSLEIMNLANALLDSLNEVSSMNNLQGSRIIFNSNSTDKYDTYVRSNIIFDYATYRTLFFKVIGATNVYHYNIKSQFDNEETDGDSLQLLILNIARYAYVFENVNDSSVWDEIQTSYSENKKVSEICEQFKEQTFNEKSVYNIALMLAEYEKNNDLFLHTNEVAIEEALEACDNVVNFFNNSYLTYWETKQKYYSSVLDGQRQTICLDFIAAHDLEEKNEVFGLKNKINVNFNKVERNGELINKFKSIKKQKLSFSDIINNEEKISVEDEVDKIFLDVDREKIAKDAEEQAKSIIELERERDQLKKDAEEFAKIILKTQRDHRKILEAAEEQARRIIHLERENEELKRLAQENAQYLLEEDMKTMELAKQAKVNTGVVADDTEKINQLLSDLSIVKNMDFVVNRPTIMQDISFLEEKIVNFLSGKDVKDVQKEVVTTIENANPMEVKPVESLLALLKNSYMSSHYYEKDGRYSLIDFTPFDEDTYRATMYSIKDTEKEMLMEAYFEEYQLTDDVLKEICSIFSKDSVIVASKVNNRDNDRQDYVVIDVKSNTLRFVNFRKDLVDRIREFI